MAKTVSITERPREAAGLVIKYEECHVNRLANRKPGAGGSAGR